MGRGLGQGQGHNIGAGRGHGSGLLRAGGQQAQRLRRSIPIGYYGLVIPACGEESKVLSCTHLSAADMACPGTLQLNFSHCSCSTIPAIPPAVAATAATAAAHHVGGSVANHGARPVWVAAGHGRQQRGWDFRVTRDCVVRGWAPRLGCQGLE